MLIQDAVTVAGYRPAGMDNEGFEAGSFSQPGCMPQGRRACGGPAARVGGTSTSVLLDRDAEPSLTTLPTTIP